MKKIIEELKRIADAWSDRYEETNDRFALGQYGAYMDVIKKLERYEDERAGEV